MIKSEREVIYLDEVISILDHVLKCDHPTLLIEYVKYRIEHLHSITLSDMEDKDVE